MKRLENLWRVMANELAVFCHTSATRDGETVARRVEHEGESFMTVTLPSFGKDFERAIDQGYISDGLFLAFKRDRAGLPRFLGGFLRNVFDENGLLLEPSASQIEAIFAVRQLTGVFAKIERPYSDSTKARAIKGYRSADEETGRWDKTSPEPLLEDFSRVAHLLFRDVLTNVDRDVHDGKLTPKHGPGAVAEKVLGNAKYDFTNWPTRLDTVFPFTEYGVSSVRYSYRAASVSSPHEDKETPSRVILVPKTVKKPRIIAAEPAALQWCQQAVAGSLVEELESDYTVRSMIGFTHQQPNRDLARIGSIDKSLATLDMSEASDRVSLKQALALVKHFPWVRDAFLATRSQLATLPDGETIPLQKFASMGSAICFPVEAMVFLTAVFLGIERKLIADGSRTLLSRRVIKDFEGSVRVYGDDIIVPVDMVDCVLEVFTQLGWHTNTNKSFWTGLFRESCGGDFYAGEDVCITRLKQDIPRSRKDVKQIASLVSFRNQLYQAGLWQTAMALDKTIVRVLRHYPVVDSTSALLGRESFYGYIGQRDCMRLHRPLVKGWMLRTKIPNNESSFEGKLLKCLGFVDEQAPLLWGEARFIDPMHLLQSGRPQSSDIKLRWSTPF